MKPEQVTEPSAPVCGRCRLGDHFRCVGIACECEATSRCKANATLSRRARSGGPDAA